jgi:hypothetical protein
MMFCIANLSFYGIHYLSQSQEEKKSDPGSAFPNCCYIFNSKNDRSPKNRSWAQTLFMVDIVY